MTDPKETDTRRVVEELRELGRQLGETLEAAWKSAERKEAERELRAGARAFAEEVGSAWGRARNSKTADLGPKARRSAVEALRWMSAELESLADRFTPAEPGSDEPEAPRDGGS
ncbi:MAG TPA: hypothetical protein VJ982_11690 [Gemmatimonadota bacterium]|nr:hypothetical protein [Gemmatimonadota bacterium]